MDLLDENAFMEASHLYYGFDIAHGFRSWLKSPALDGEVASVQTVKDKIARGTGDLVTRRQRVATGLLAAGH